LTYLLPFANLSRYTVIESNLEQFIEIPAGVIPLLLFDALGYVRCV
jgi:hypothetical protein